MKLRLAFRPAYFEARYNGLSPAAAFEWALSVQFSFDSI